MLRFTNIYGKFHFRSHIQNCQFDWATYRATQREGQERRKGVHWNDVISFHNLWHLIFFSLFCSSLFSLPIDLFHLLFGDARSEWTLNYIIGQMTMHKKKKKKRKTEGQFFVGMNRWWFDSPRKKKHTKFLKLRSVCVCVCMEESLESHYTWFSMALFLIRFSIFLVLLLLCVVYFICLTMCILNSVKCIRFNSNIISGYECTNFIEKCILIRPTEVMHFLTCNQYQNHTHT